jgi:hypothetical protein
MPKLDPSVLHHPAVVQQFEHRASDFQLRIADKITAFAGSMGFVYIHIAPTSHGQVPPRPPCCSSRSIGRGPTQRGWANWFDPEVPEVRLALVFAMLASLLMAVAIPEGFGDHALLFAASYCLLQIGRNGFVVTVTRAAGSTATSNKS